MATKGLDKLLSLVSFVKNGQDVFYSTNILDEVEKERGEEYIKQLGSELVEKFNADLASCAEYIEKQEDALKIATQFIEEKTDPWPGCSNVKHPIVTIACNQFGSRAYPELIPSRKLVHSRIIKTEGDVNPELTKVAKRIEDHVNFQIFEEIDNWEEKMDRLLHVDLPGFGIAFKKLSWDVVTDKPRHDVLSYRDLIINYTEKDFYSAKRKSHILWLDKNEVETYFRADVFAGKRPDTDYVQSQMSSDLLLLKTLKMEHLGLQDHNQDTLLPYIEMHTLADLDDDGYEEPWIITFSYCGGEVVRISPGFDPEEIKYNLKTKEIISIQRIESFIKYGFLNNPSSPIYDLGFNMLLLPLVESINTLTNQLIDAGTLSIMPFGFLTSSFSTQAKTLRFKPMEFKTVNLMGTDLAKGIFIVPTKEPNGILFQLLSLLQGMAYQIASVNDSMMGENPGQNTKVGTTLSMLEQGLKIFSSIYKRIHKSLSHEFNLLLKLNRIYIDDEKLIKSLKDEKVFVVSKEDYQQNIAITLVSDPNLSTAVQKSIKSNRLLELGGNTGVLDMVAVTRRVLEDEGHINIEELFAKPQDPVPTISEQIELQKLEIDKLYKNQTILVNLLKALDDKEISLKQQDQDQFKLLMEQTAVDVANSAKSELASKKGVESE